MNLCYVVIFLCLSVYLAMTYVVRNDYYTKAESMYGTMGLLSDIPYHQARVSFFNNRIWCVLSYHYFDTHTTAYQPLSDEVNQLANKFSRVVEATLHENYPLEYNENILRNYSLFDYANGVASYENITLNYKSALENYISCGKIMQD